MDIILTFPVKTLKYENAAGNIADYQRKLQEICYKLISDGTGQFIQEIMDSELLTTEEKSEQILTFVSVFPQAFDMSSGKPKLKKEYRTRLKEIYESTDEEHVLNAKHVYSLYSNYSKYDHLSHWTSMALTIPFDRRMEKLDLSIIFMTMHLRDLLMVALDYKELCAYFENHLQEIWRLLREHFQLSNDSIS